MQKIVIISHAGVDFNLDDRIKKNSYLLKGRLNDRKEKMVMFYEKKIRNAARSDKKYVLMKYNPLIAECFERLMSETGETNYNEWIYITFYHDTKMTEANSTAKKNLERYARGFLAVMGKHDFIRKQQIPYRHTLKEKELGETGNLRKVKRDDNKIATSKTVQVKIAS